ncbi:MAG: chain-length determining protein [Bacteroidales bacterium]|nr:chain-length determining protein [Bacteroidales bacterium]
MAVKEKRTALRLGEEQSVDLMGLFSKVWDSRKIIIRWCIIGAVIGLVAGFSIPKTYRVRAILAPETQQRVGSGVSSIASMMGVSLDNSMDAIDVDMYPDVITSTPFLFNLLDLEVRTRDGEVCTSLKDYVVNYQKQPWWSHLTSAPGKAVRWAVGLVRPKKEEVAADTVLNIRNLPKEERAAMKYLGSIINVDVDKKTGKTLLALEMQDPDVAATVLESVLENLKTYMSDYRTSKSRQDVDNLTKICEERKQEYYEAQKAYAQMTDNNRNVVLNSTKADLQRMQQEVNLAYQVYSQVATQLEGARIKVQQSKPVFVVLEPVTVPMKKAGPSKSKLLILFTFMAGCCAFAWVLFGKDMWDNIRNNR